MHDTNVSIVSHWTIIDQFKAIDWYEVSNFFSHWTSSIPDYQVMKIYQLMKMVWKLMTLSILHTFGCDVTCPRHAPAVLPLVARHQSKSQFGNSSKIMFPLNFVTDTYTLQCKMFFLFMLTIPIAPRSISYAENRFIFSAVSEQIWLLAFDHA